MTALLGLAAAFGYGLSDFLGGLLSRRLPYAVVAMIGNAVALGFTLVSILLTEPAQPTAEALMWGAASGLGSAFGTLVLFRGLARGQMGIVAPLSALGTAALPVMIGVALGDRPSAIAWAGVALALPAIWLISTSGSPAVGGKLGAGVVDGLLAGVGFALLLVGLGLAGDGSGLRPVAAMQATSLAILAVLTIARRPALDRGALTSRDIAGLAAMGISGGIAAVCYFLSTHEGLLSIVAVLTSLYPAVTVVLAAMLLHEAITRRQAVGLAIAVAAVLLIVLG